MHVALREGDADALGVEGALRMVTSEAAALLGRPDLGALLPGRWADMVRVSLDDVVYDPVLAPRDLLGHLVWAGSRRGSAQISHISLPLRVMLKQTGQKAVADFNTSRASASFFPASLARDRASGMSATSFIPTISAT